MSTWDVVVGIEDKANRGWTNLPVELVMSAPLPIWIHSMSAQHCFAMKRKAANKAYLRPVYEPIQAMMYSMKSPRASVILLRFTPVTVGCVILYK